VGAHRGRVYYEYLTSSSKTQPKVNGFLGGPFRPRHPLQGTDRL
jgi:hypothetical protein